MRALIASALILLAGFSSAASIWHVEGKQEFYLFGTFHALKPDTYPLPPVYDQAFNQCDNLWLEANTGEFSDPTVVQKVQSLMMLPSGQTLSSVLSAESYKLLEQLADMAGVPLMMLQNFKPWAATNLLTINMFKIKGFDVEHGLDLYLQSKASERGLPVNSFESVIWQMQMYDAMSAQSDDDLVEFSTSGIERIDHMINSMYRYWQAGDVEGLYELAEFDDYPHVEDEMLTKRNYRWMGILEDLPKGKTNCVAVGALHMAGKHGLLNQFEFAGYKVKQLD